MLGFLSVISLRYLVNGLLRYFWLVRHLSSLFLGFCFLRDSLNFNRLFLVLNFLIKLSFRGLSFVLTFFLIWFLEIFFFNFKLTFLGRFLDFLIFRDALMLTRWCLRWLGLSYMRELVLSRISRLGLLRWLRCWQYLLLTWSGVLGSSASSGKIRVIAVRIIRTITLSAAILTSSWSSRVSTRSAWLWLISRRNACICS